MANNIPLEEQETIIIFMRNQKHAIISTSDTTQITKYDKKVEAAPNMYSVLKEWDNGYKIYRCEDKDMISARTKKREYSEEQKKAAGERLQKNRNTKNV